MTATAIEIASPVMRELPDPTLPLAGGLQPRRATDMMPMSSVRTVDGPKRFQSEPSADSWRMGLGELGPPPERSDGQLPSGCTKRRQAFGQGGPDFYDGAEAIESILHPSI